MPGNMRTMIFPDAEAFQQFPARGPEGVNLCDINGRAAAIECYLDLNLLGRPRAQVIWSNYKKEVDDWQGALEHKGSYVCRFLALTSESLRENEYQAHPNYN